MFLRFRSFLSKRIQEDAEIIRQLQHKFHNSFNEFVFVKFMTLLGTHTMFLVGLPFLFWLADPRFARHITLILGQGVICTNIVKDYFHLPRPSSPPVSRKLHQKGSTHPYEYGFPSTHSCNGSSLVTFTLSYFGHSIYRASEPSITFGLAAFGFLGYALFLPFSRIYCGMHSFSDTVFGVLLGLMVTLVHQNIFGPLLDYAIDQPNETAQFLGIPIQHLSAVVGILGLAFYFAQVFVLHPGPPNPCPCYDDSVCFAGVGAGVVGGAVNLALYPTLNCLPVDQTSYVFAVRRILVGTALLMIWRSCVKFIGWTFLGPLFKFLKWPLMSGLKTSMLLKQEEKERAAAKKSEGYTDTTTILHSRSLKDDSTHPQFKMHRYSLEMLLKLFTYTGIGFGAVDLIPRFFCQLGL